MGDGYGLALEPGGIKKSEMEVRIIARR